MTEHYFAALEQKLDQLIKRLGQLEEQNRALRSKNAKLEEERAQLVQSSDATRAQVEAMLTRLKTLEKTK
jgi:cell division protein ZapB